MASLECDRLPVYLASHFYRLHDVGPRVADAGGERIEVLVQGLKAEFEGVEPEGDVIDGAQRDVGERGEFVMRQHVEDRVARDVTVLNRVSSIAARGILTLMCATIGRLFTDVQHLHHPQPPQLYGLQRPPRDP